MFKRTITAIWGIINNTMKVGELWPKQLISSYIGPIMIDFNRKIVLVVFSKANIALSSQ